MTSAKDALVALRRLAARYGTAPASTSSTPRGSEEGWEWQCAVCGFRNPEPVRHRLVGIHECPTTKWNRVPSSRSDHRPTMAELADRALSHEQQQALRRMERGHLSPERSRRRAADELESMRSTLLDLRRHWREALEHQAAVGLAEPESVRSHEERAESARHLAAEDMERLRQDLAEVERHVSEAKVADEAKAIAKWNAATLVWRRLKARERLVPDPHEAVGAELFKQARAVVAEAEAGPTEEMKIEAAMVARARTGKGDRAGRWEQSAARENARRERAAPLLVHAGIVPRATPDERRVRINAGIAHGHEARQEHERDRETRARRYRSLVAAAVSPSELAELEARRGFLPDEPAYGLDFWHGEARKRGLAPEDPVWGEIRALEARDRARHAADDTGAQEDLFAPREDER